MATVLWPWQRTLPASVSAASQRRRVRFFGGKEDEGEQTTMTGVKGAEERQRIPPKALLGHRDATGQATPHGNGSVVQWGSESSSSGQTQDCTVDEVVILNPRHLLRTSPDESTSPRDDDSLDTAEVAQMLWEGKVDLIWAAPEKRLLWQRRPWASQVGGGDERRPEDDDDSDDGWHEDPIESEQPVITVPASPSTHGSESSLEEFRVFYRQGTRKDEPDVVQSVRSSERLRAVMENHDQRHGEGMASSTEGEATSTAENTSAKQNGSKSRKKEKKSTPVLLSNSSFYDNDSSWRHKYVVNQPIRLKDTENDKIIVIPNRITELKSQCAGLMDSISWVYAVLLVSVTITLTITMTTSAVVPAHYYTGFCVVIIALGIIILVYFYIYWIISCIKKESSTPPVSPIPPPHARIISKAIQIMALRNAAITGELPMRVILVIMGLLSAALSVLHFVQYLLSTCIPSLVGVSNILTAIFILLQLPFLVRNNKLAEFSYSKPFCKLLGMHLVVTNALIAIYAIVTTTEFYLRMRIFLVFSSSCLTCEHYAYFRFLTNPDLRVCEFPVPLIRHLYLTSLYLHPVLVGFCFASCVLLISVWRIVSRGPVVTDENDFYDRWGPETRRCRMAVSIVIGVMLVAMIAAMIALFFIVVNQWNDVEFGLRLLRGASIATHCAVVIVLVAIAVRLQPLGTDTVKDSSFAAALLLGAAGGLFIHDAFRVAASHHAGDEILALVAGVLSVATAAVQVVILLCACRCYALTAAQADRAPGRLSLVILASLNVCLILLNLVETHSDERISLGPKVFGQLGWALIQTVTGPFRLLFRFVCLARCFHAINVVYKVPRRLIAAANLLEENA